MNVVDIYKAAVAKWGQDVQLDVLVEEMLEAIVAVIDFKDPSTADDMRSNFKKNKMKTDEGFLEGLQGFIDDSGLTIAQFIKIQASTLKTVMKYLRKGRVSMYNEPLDISKIMMASMMEPDKDDGEDMRERLADELADVEIMIDQARHGMGLNSMIDARKAYKIARLVKRLEK